jgi:hypothetical protein
LQDPERASVRLPLAFGRAQLMSLLAGTRTELEHVVGDLTLAELTGRTDASGWTVKDHLAHVVAWEQILIDRLAGQSEHQAAGISADNLAAFSADGSEDPTDALNQMIYERWQYVPLDEVLDSFRRSHEELLQTLSGMSDEDLLAPLDPEGGTSRMRRIAEDAYWHYADHAAWIARG